MSLVVVLTSFLLVNGSYAERQEQSGDSEKIPVVEKPVSFEAIMDSLNIAVTSQGFIISLFPIYSSMARHARPKIMHSVTFALIFTLSIYTVLSIVSI